MPNERVSFLRRRERSKVPYIVRQCIEEVEKRGIDEVGIYRISGVATDIQALKAAFDTSKRTAPGPTYLKRSILRVISAWWDGDFTPRLHARVLAALLIARLAQAVIKAFKISLNLIS